PGDGLVGGRSSPADVEGTVHVSGPLVLVNRFVRFPPLEGQVTVDLEGRFGRASVLPTLRGKVSGHGMQLERYHLMSDLAADVSIEDDVVHAEQVAIGFSEGTI